VSILVGAEMVCLIESQFGIIFTNFCYRVKLAIDLRSKKQVAIKIMRVKNIINKKECLECLFTEINILTECRHPNVVKILDASFDGAVVKGVKPSSLANQAKDSQI